MVHMSHGADMRQVGHKLQIHSKGFRMLGSGCHGDGELGQDEVIDGRTDTATCAQPRRRDGCSAAD